jgi:GTP-binding protein
LVVLNKLDVEGAEALAERFCQALPDCEVFRMSAATRQGLDKIKTSMAKKLEQLDERPQS